MYLSRFLRTVVPQNRTQNLLRVSLLKSKAQREGEKTRNYSANWKNFVITCSELVAFSIRGDGTFRTENWAWHHRMTDSSLWHTQAQINRKMMVVSKRWSAPRREISRSWKGFALKISSFRYGRYMVTSNPLSGNWNYWQLWIWIENWLLRESHNLK